MGREDNSSWGGYLESSERLILGRVLIGDSLRSKGFEGHHAANIMVV